jgi:hypothetical protein
MGQGNPAPGAEFYGDPKRLVARLFCLNKLTGNAHIDRKKGRPEVSAPRTMVRLMLVRLGIPAHRGGFRQFHVYVHVLTAVQVNPAGSKEEANA